MKNESKKRLTPREKRFCYFYVNTGNVEESALRAGYGEKSKKYGSKLISKEEINLEIEKLYDQKKKNLLYMACSGYERLAFGNISDAIKLVFAENLDLIKIEEMDFFNVAEIKKLKDGAMEVKFFDRIKALEKLQQMNFTEQKQALSFYNAIERGTNIFSADDQT